MTEGALRGSTPTTRLVPALIALGVVAALVGVGVLIYFMVRPRGERVGEVNLLASGASIEVSADVGDSLFFRTDATMRMALLSMADDEQLEREASELLRESRLTVRAIAPSGSDRVATCALYNGRATSTTSTTGSFSRSGMLNDCTLVIDEAGRWEVRGAVVWAPKVDVTRATLELRREVAASK